MIDCHSHTLFSDGDLLPSESVRRYVKAGYEAVVLSDHIDGSTVDFVIPRLAEVCAQLNEVWPIRAIPGGELTHVPIEHMSLLAEQARDLGARIVLAHGETIVEPVLEGTNHAAIEAEVDILAHPGMISLRDAELAAERGVRLEISGRQGHCLTNGHVVHMARQTGAKLSYGTDLHSSGNLFPPSKVVDVLRGAGLREEEAKSLLNELKKWLLS